MHGDDQEAIAWFFNGVLYGGNLVLHENADICDDIGTIKVIRISEEIERLRRSLKNIADNQHQPTNPSAQLLAGIAKSALEA